MAGTNKKNMRNQLDTTTLGLSMIVGAVGCLISGILYTLMKEALWTPLAVGISFLVFSTVFILGMLLVSMMNGNLSYHVARFHDGGSITAALVLILVLSLVLGILFEFLYEINFSSQEDIYQEPTSYIFLIDDSGSMENNDPGCIRYKAISEIISEKDGEFPYAVYSFNDGFSEERALAPISVGSNEFNSHEAYGGTMMKTALSQLHDLYKQDSQNLLGAAPKILLLSDGYAQDIGFFSSIDSVLKSYKKSKFAISTVGFGAPDGELMQQIADETGGIYINVDDISQLEDAMEVAITTNAEDTAVRTLYTYRNVPNLGWLYGILRILFLSILGILISVSSLFSTGRGEDSELIFISSIITGIVAAVLMELGINTLRIPPILMRILYFLLVAMTLINLRAIGGRGKGRDENISYDFSGEYKVLESGDLFSVESRSTGKSEDDFFSKY